MAHHIIIIFPLSVLLLIEGGFFIAKAIMRQNISRLHYSIGVLPRSNKQKPIHRKQYEKLKADINRWDLKLSVGVLMNVFRRNLKSGEKEMPKFLRDIRNEMYMHCTTVALDKSKYEDITEDLHGIITTLASTFDTSVQQQCSSCIKQFTTEPLYDDISFEKGDIKGDLHGKKSFGQFIDTHGHVETVLEIRNKWEASKSVCILVQGNFTATGFRVGPSYIMTAAHVTNTILQGLRFDIETYAVFNYIKVGVFEDENKFFFKEVVYTDLELDISVIELRESSHPFPPPFTTFDVPSLEGCFNLIGHSQGNVMEINQVTTIVNIDTPGVRDKLEQIQRKSSEHTGKRYDDPPYNTLENPHRFLFHCKFTKGGSGSPGVVVIDEKVIVLTVLLYGFPDWYYDPSMEMNKMNWPLEYCIEQGVNMMSVLERMRQTNPALCMDIFRM